MVGRKRQLIALGGGGFLMEPENLALKLYILGTEKGTGTGTGTFLVGFCC